MELLHGTELNIAPDGMVWFTVQQGNFVGRLDPKSGDIKVVVDDFVEPNGLAFSPDEKKLYVIDTGFTDGPDNPSHIRVFDLDVAAGKVSNSKVFAEIPKPSITDGLRCDREGRLWCSVGWGDPNEDGVRCYTADGDLLGKDIDSDSVTAFTAVNGTWSTAEIWPDWRSAIMESAFV